MIWWSEDHFPFEMATFQRTSANFLGVSGNQSQFEYIPPGKDQMAIATPIRLALSWPLTDRHRTWGSG